MDKEEKKILKREINTNKVETQEKIVFQYSFFKRCLALSFRLMGIVIGVQLLAIDNFMVQIFSILILFICTIDFINVLNFKSLIFYEDKIEKEMFFNIGISMLPYLNMQVMLINNFFGGLLMFWTKGKRFQLAFFFLFDLLPIQKKYLYSVKQLLIKKQVIKGDENEWNI